MRPSVRMSVALLALIAACSRDGGPVTLGMAGPLKEGFGIENRRGVELAVAEINAAGGIDGDSLLIEYRDDDGEGAKAAVIAQEFVDDPRVLAVVGHVTSGAMLAAAKVYDGHLAAIATTASSATLTGISPWAFRVISSDSANGVDLAHFAQRLGKRRVAVLYENDAYGRGLADAFRRSFNGEVISFDPIGFEGKRAPIYMEWLASRRPDLVFVAGTERTGLAFIAAGRAAGLTADYLGGDGWTGVRSDSVVSEGALVGAPFTPLDPRPEAQRFVQAYRTRFNGDEPDGNAALSYDAVQLLVAAIRGGGRDREAIRDWLAGLREAGAHAGITGAIAFDESGDPVGKSFTMTRVSRGHLVLAERSAP
ncbi:MAG: ABC transporter substrate-binding protein [Gemmatimonadetes bacterium]|nr:ABC transporter substrate-binding protein [Gemmatimonadota bacterium]